MSSAPLNMVAPPEVYRERRKRLAGKLRRPLVLLAGRARSRNYAAATYPFRAGSHYLYFGGPPLEGAAWLIEPGSDGDAGCTLLRPEVSVDDAVWFGEAPSDALLAAAAGIRGSNIATPESLPALLKKRQSVFLAPPCPTSIAWAHELGLAPAEPEEILPIVELRLVKDSFELTAMRNAADAAVAAHLAAMRVCTPGFREADVLAAWSAEVFTHQCTYAFTPIVTVRGEVLHTDRCPYTLQAGQMLLVDAGAEEPGGYASDITRTYPVSGSFTPIQRQLYDVVLRAQQEAIAACVPGRRFRDIHDLAARVICEGLVQAGLLRGKPTELAERRAHTLFFTHGLGHLVGLDVHDMEDVGDLAGYATGRSRRAAFGDKFLRLDRDLLPGMALTVEPGIYLSPALWRNADVVSSLADVVNRPAVDALLEQNFGGIRIEETIVVRGADEPGPEVLTGALPHSAEAVCNIVGQLE